MGPPSCRPARSPADRASPKAWIRPSAPADQKPGNSGTGGGGAGSGAGAAAAAAERPARRRSCRPPAGGSPAAARRAARRGSRSAPTSRWPAMLGNGAAGAVGGGERRTPPWGRCRGGRPSRPAAGRRRRAPGPGGTYAAGVVAEHGDPGGPRVVALDVGADDAPAALVLAGGRLARAVGAGEAAFVDPALLVDDEVVPDVVPAVVAGVVGVDRPHGLGRVGVVVRGHRVVHDQLRDRRELDRPLPHPLVGPPGLARVITSGCGGAGPVDHPSRPEPVAVDAGGSDPGRAGVDGHDLEPGCRPASAAPAGTPPERAARARGDQPGVVVTGVLPDRQRLPGAPGARAPASGSRPCRLRCPCHRTPTWVAGNGSRTSAVPGAGRGRHRDRGQAGCRLSAALVGARAGRPNPAAARTVTTTRLRQESPRVWPHGLASCNGRAARWRTTARDAQSAAQPQPQ